METIVRRKSLCTMATRCNEGVRTNDAKAASEENRTDLHCIACNCDFLRWTTIEVIEPPK